jgi:hypothetical protein
MAMIENLTNRIYNPSRPSSMSNIDEYQRDMRRAYIWGATGIVTSGVVWLIAGLVAYFVSPKNAVWTLFIGASLIFPVSNVIDRLLGASGKHAATNPLGKLALEGTIFMLMCLPLAYAISIYRMEWFFPAVLMIIGGRYLTFGTIYGTRLYWLLGALFGMAAWISVSLALPPHTSALIGAAIEIVFGLVLYMTKRNA